MFGKKEHINTALRVCILMSFWKILFPGDYILSFGYLLHSDHFYLYKCNVTINNFQLHVILLPTNSKNIIGCYLWCPIIESNGNFIRYILRQILYLLFVFNILAAVLLNIPIPSLVLLPISANSKLILHIAKFVDSHVAKMVAMHEQAIQDVYTTSSKLLENFR